jgi:hypothetical protein
MNKKYLQIIERQMNDQEWRRMIENEQIMYLRKNWKKF